MKTILQTDYQRAMKSLHIPFLQEMAMRLNAAGINEEVENLIERIYYLTEGYKYPEPWTVERIRRLWKERNVT